MDIKEAMETLKRVVYSAQFSFDGENQVTAPIGLSDWLAARTAFETLQYVFMEVYTLKHLRESDDLCTYPLEKCKKSRIYEMMKGKP